MQAEAYKCCAYCGEQFKRNPKHSQKQWNDTRCCSKSCAIRQHFKEHPRPTSEGECGGCGAHVERRTKGLCRNCYARHRYRQPHRREYYARRYQENRERELEMRRRWRESNPDYFKQDRVLRAALDRQQKRYFGGLREAVVERDSATCQDCGTGDLGPRQLHVHHVDGDKSHNEMANLVVLCNSCHAKRHHAQGDFDHLYGRREDAA